MKNEGFRPGYAALLLSLWLISFFVTGCSPGSQEQIATRWMGPSADGHYPDKRLLKQWPEEGPEILWIYDSLGIGFGSAAIQGKYLYTTGMIDSTGYLYKMNLSGELVYSVPYGPEWNGSYPGSRGTPTLVGDKGYLVSGMGRLVCFNIDDGGISWTRDYISDFGGENIRWGIAEIPVVEGDIVYATPGGKEFNVVALNRHNGEMIWSCSGSGDLSAYCTPLIFEHNGRSMLVTYTASHLLGIDRKNGELLWSFDVPWEWSVHECTPLYINGEILFPTGNEVGGGKLRLSEDGSSVTLLWENNVCDFTLSAIYEDGYVYSSYGDYKRLNWSCSDWISGEEVFTSKDLNPGKCLIADGMMYIYTAGGELVLVRPDPSGFRIISKAIVRKGSGLHMALPVLHKGILYVRHGNAMIAYKV
jgi:outer membrane protein assembly factor BamB